MNLLQLLTSNVNLDCPVVAHNSSSNLRLFWKNTYRITGQGLAKWYKLMKCEVIQNEEYGILEIPDANPRELESFLTVVSGERTKGDSKMLIARDGEPAACECERCNNKDCSSRGTHRRFPIAIGGMSECPRLFD